MLEQLAIEDKILIRALGRSLALSDYPDVQLKSCSPGLLDALEVRADEPGVLTVPVAAEVPPLLAGAGAGLAAESGAVQIQTEDEAALREAGLDGLRLGDIVALRDFDTRWGPGYLAGAVTIGVVAHGDSPRGGHGPGVTPLMTAAPAASSPSCGPSATWPTCSGLRTAEEAAA